MSWDGKNIIYDINYQSKKINKTKFVLELCYGTLILVVSGWVNIVVSASVILFSFLYLFSVVLAELSVVILRETAIPFIMRVTLKIKSYNHQSCI